MRWPAQISPPPRGGRPAHRQIALSGGARLGLKHSALSGSGLGLNALPQPRAEQRFAGKSTAPRSND